MYIKNIHEVSRVRKWKCVYSSVVNMLKEDTSITNITTMTLRSLISKQFQSLNILIFTPEVTVLWDIKLSLEKKKCLCYFCYLNCSEKT